MVRYTNVGGVIITLSMVDARARETVGGYYVKRGGVCLTVSA